MPDTVPSVVLVSLIVGFEKLTNICHLTVISEPPLEMILPPDTAEVYVTEPCLLWLILGTTRAVVVNVQFISISSSYAISSISIAHGILFLELILSDYL